ncbi:cytochrome P450 4C1 [Aethina tumida]|uniref:cytochrome P450 4C1 n=1 Tax=Aethina tumida TaxID=116153 RepID=UPI002148BE5D|nr:cytochrome P450 4C1 [Aethina tumida]
MFELVIFLLTLIIYYYVTLSKKSGPYKSFYEVPGPRNLPVIGTTYLFLGKNLLKVVLSLLKKYGRCFLVYVPHRMYCTTIPEEIKVILNHPNSLNKSEDYKHLQEIFKNTLLLAPVEEWRKHRKLINKSFKQGILDMFVDVFYEKSQILSNILKNGKYDNLTYLFEKFTLDVFCEATIGIESTILVDEKEHEYVTAVRTTQHLAFDRVAKLFKTNDFCYSFFPESKVLAKNMEDMKSFIRNVIKYKRSVSEDDHFLTSDKLPVLDLLLENSKKERLTDDYIQEEMNLFAGAAADTTAFTIAYTCLLLAMHPKIQERVYKEIIDAVGKEGIIDQSDLSKFVYTDMAIKESQRLLPVVPLIARIASADIQLGDKLIPANTSMSICFLELHRNPDIYPNPLEYNPDRFLPEEVAKRPDYTFLPFSGGPRNCIGMKYASMLLKTVIATIVRDFELTTKHKSIAELDFESHVVMTPTHPLDLSFIPRNK